MASIGLPRWVSGSTQSPGRDRRPRAMFKELRPEAEAPEAFFIYGDSPACRGYRKRGRRRSRPTNRPGFTASSVSREGSERPNVTSPIQVGVVSSQLTPHPESDGVCAAKTTLLGRCKVLPQEFSESPLEDHRYRELDQTGVMPRGETSLSSPTGRPTRVAYREGQRWVQEFVPSPLGQAPQESTRLANGCLSDQRAVLGT